MGLILVEAAGPGVAELFNRVGFKGLCLTVYGVVSVPLLRYFLPIPSMADCPTVALRGGKAGGDMV